jgi:hypothetical protein
MSSILSGIQSDLRILATNLFIIEGRERNVGAIRLKTMLGHAKAHRRHTEMESYKYKLGSDIDVQLPFENEATE